MSGAAVGAVGDLVAAGKLTPAPGLSVATLARVLTELAQHYGPRRRILPSQVRISARTGLSERHVRRALAELVRQGHAERELVGRHHEYALPLVATLPADELAQHRTRGARTPDKGAAQHRTPRPPNRDLTVNEPRTDERGTFLPGTGWV